MVKDRQGNAMSGASPATAELYDAALHAFNIYRGDPIALLDQALQATPDFAMAHIAKSHMFATTSEPGALREAKAILASAKKLKLNERELSHVVALEHLFKGKWSEAAVALDHHNVSFPLDLLALQSGHLLDFFRANARNLRDRIARVLPAWTPDLPGYPIVRGMYAFGLEESGDYDHAEQEGRLALSIEPLDCWAHHAVTHVMEMQGRAEEGIAWMIERERFWSGDDNAFKVHNWWHRAIFHLDLGQHDEALALYDGAVRKDRGQLALELVDASSLLWRLHLLEVDVGNRWQEPADAWLPHVDGKTYPFNDWHAAMALLGDGRFDEVEGLIATLREHAQGSSETSSWARNFGLPLAEGFTDFWNGDYESAANKLYGARFIANAFGGSHAQRDVIDWTLTEAAVRAGQTGLATALVNERSAAKPHSSVNNGFMSRLTRSSAVQYKAVS